MGAAEPILQTIAKPGETWELTKDKVAPKLIWLRHLNGEARVWFHFVISNVMPSSNQAEVILKRAVLIHTIMTRAKVELPILLQDSIYDMAHSDSDSAALGHCSLIQLLCQKAGVDVTDNGAPTKLHPTIDAAMITKQLKIGGGEVTGLTPGRKSTTQSDDEFEERLRTGEQWTVNTDFRMRHLRRRLRFMQSSQHSFQIYMVTMLKSICEAQGLDVIDYQPAVYPHSDEEEAFEAMARTHYADHVDGAAPTDGATSSHAAHTSERQPVVDATTTETTAAAADPPADTGAMDEDRGIDPEYNPLPTADPGSYLVFSDDEESTD